MSILGSSFCRRETKHADSECKCPSIQFRRWRTSTPPSGYQVHVCQSRGLVGGAGASLWHAKHWKYPSGRTDCQTAVSLLTQLPWIASISPTTSGTCPILDMTSENVLGGEMGTIPQIENTEQFSYHCELFSGYVFVPRLPEPDREILVCCLLRLRRVFSSQLTWVTASGRSVGIILTGTSSKIVGIG